MAKRKPLKGCPIDFEITDKDRRIVEEIHATGGNLTAAEFAHTRQFDRRAFAWTKYRAEAHIRRDPEHYVGAHTHADGSIWIPRIGPVD